MKFIIPTKTTSKRVPNKNWVEFFDGKSLVEITIEKLEAAGIDRSDVYVATESKDITDYGLGINWIMRSNESTSDYCSWPEVFRELSSLVPGDEDIGWCHVCDPLFDEYAKAISQWNKDRNNFDSLCVVYPLPKYILGPMMQPTWSVGEHHRPSQMLPTCYQVPFAFSILPRDTIQRYGYWFGGNPLWYVAERNGIDIDTMEDFEIAQLYYAEKQKALAE